MHNSQKQKKNPKKQREENLDIRNGAGYFDPTAYLALTRIIDNEKRSDKQVTVVKVK